MFLARRHPGRHDQQAMSSGPIHRLLESIRACRVCAEHLPHEPRPVLRISTTARLLIVGQAPGRRVHTTGIPFNDPSGDRLRMWMGVDRATFYDTRRVAIVPMGFCYPGKDASGDLPPRPECAATWRDQVLSLLPRIELTLAIGQYAIAWHLKGRAKETLAETVRAWRDYAPDVMPLPHPSPRNNLWLRRHPWFESEIAPALQRRVGKLING